MATDPLDKLLLDLAREYSDPPPAPAAPPPAAPAPAAPVVDNFHTSTGPLPAPPGPPELPLGLGLADAPVDEVHPALRALMSAPEPPAATPWSPAAPAPVAIGKPEHALLASIQQEEVTALRAEQERLRQEEEVLKLRAQVEQRRKEEEARQRAEQERLRLAAEAQQKAAAAAAQKLQDERRRLEIERAIRAQAEAWLKKLDPNSDEGQWFNQYAARYPDRLQAAIDYLREIKGLGLSARLPRGPRQVRARGWPGGCGPGRRAAGYTRAISRG